MKGPTHEVLKRLGQRIQPLSDPDGDSFLLQAKAESGQTKIGGRGGKKLIEGK